VQVLVFLSLFPFSLARLEKRAFSLFEREKIKDASIGDARAGFSFRSDRDALRAN